jgi:hypothetical protein
MKKLTHLLFALVCTLPVQGYARITLPDGVPRVRWIPNPLYNEEGFRLGYILRFEDVIFWHFEGKFMMGFGSSPQTIIDKDCLAEATAAAQSKSNKRIRTKALERVNELCFVDVNPWPFSVLDPNLYADFKNVGVTPVVLYYTRPITKPYEIIQARSFRAIFSETRNFTQKMWRVDPNLKAPTFYSLEQGELPVARHVNPAVGYTEGRVVKATMDHYLRKTYEITLQQGRFGNNFARMSVNDSEMFDALVLSMMTGRLVRIGYLRLFDVYAWLSSIVWAYQTSYRITSVELLSDQEAPRPPVLK